MTPTKQEILSACINIQQEKVDKQTAMVDTLNDSAINSDKCVVGDKHHTFRAQTQNEQEMYAKQLNSAITELNTLKLISTSKIYNKAKLGALIFTTNGIYFLANSLGAIKVNRTNILVLSPLSPIGNLLLSKIKGDEIIFRGKKITIEEIC